MVIQLFEGIYLLWVDIVQRADVREQELVICCSHTLHSGFVAQVTTMRDIDQLRENAVLL